MKTHLGILTVVLTILLGSTFSFSNDISNIAKEIEFDSEIFYSVHPKESVAIFAKYREKRELYLQYFNDILQHNNIYNEDLIYDVIMFSGILRYKEILEPIKSIITINKKHAAVIRFYYYRIGYDKEASLDYLKNELDGLVSKPSDRVIIAFLPFLDDVNIALSYLDKLSPKSDGAMAELCSWAINYLYYTYKDNIYVKNKIEASYSYRRFRYDQEYR